jgi:uncharacterized protein
MTAQRTLELLAERLPEMRERFDVQELAIFGSVARNEARPDSDLDVMVTFAGRPTFDNYMGLKLYLEELFGTSVDLATEGSLRAAIRPHVEREMIHVASPGGAPRIRSSTVLDAQTLAVELDQPVTIQPKYQNNDSGH